MLICQMFALRNVLVLLVIMKSVLTRVRY